MLDSNCIFCKIIQREIPSFKLIETDHSYSFLDISPISVGHSLVIPKYHAQKLHEIPDEYLTDLMVTVKKVALKLKVENYNILQNNGELAGQEVNHVHFHIIPKTDDGSGLSYKFKHLEEDSFNLDEIQSSFNR